MPNIIIIIFNDNLKYEYDIKLLILNTLKNNQIRKKISWTFRFQTISTLYEPTW